MSTESLIAFSGRFPYEPEAPRRSVKQEHKKVSSTIVFNDVLNRGLCTEATDVTAEVILRPPEGSAVAAAPLPAGPGDGW